MRANRGPVRKETGPLIPSIRPPEKFLRSLRILPDVGGFNADCNFKSMEENLKPLCLLLLVWALLLFVPHLAAQSEHESHQHNDGMVMSDEPLDTAAQAKLMASKNESEINHHLSAMFVTPDRVIILYS